MRTEPILHPQTAAAFKHFILNPGHALIIIGPTGSGKQFTANWLCGQLLKTGNAPITPDHLLWLKPVNKQIRIEQIREAQNFAKSKQAGDNVERIIVIEEADSMADPAQNALLKLLEEPPQGVVLILLVNQETSLKTTVLSRCQLIKLLPLTNTLLKHLAPSASTDSLQKAAKLSQGYPVTFLEALTDGTTKFEEARSYLGKTIFDRIALHESFKERDSASQFVSSLRILCTAALEQAIEQQKSAAGKAWLQRTEACFLAQERLQKNAHVKLTLDLLALSLV